MTHNDGQGPVAALITTLAASLADPPAAATRVTAFVLDATGRGDHLGLWLGGQATPGGLDLLAGAISVRAQPEARVLLEWTARGDERHYRGWAVWRTAGELRWRGLSGDEAQQLPNLQTGQPLGADPLARFEP